MSESDEGELTEVDVYLEALRQGQDLMARGLVEDALAELNRLSAPATDEGKELWPAVEIMRRFPRAMLYSLAGDDEKALDEWRAVLKQAPVTPETEDLRLMAHSWILVQEQGIEGLTDEGIEGLHGDVQKFVNQQRALLGATAAFQAAGAAAAAGYESEYANQMDIAEKSIARAGAENPDAKPVLDAMYRLVDIIALSARQQRDFDRFSFDRVALLLPSIVAKGEALAKSDGVSMPQPIPMAWATELGQAFVNLATSTDGLATLLREVLSQGPSKAHLEIPTDIRVALEEERERLSELEGPAFTNAFRGIALELAAKLRHLAERLAAELRPSRRTVLNAAGIASVVSFMVVAGVLFFLGRITSTPLNTWLVLALSAFFGLVGGFGYGALRFRGFLSEVLTGRSGDAPEPTAQPADGPQKPAS